MPIEIESQLGCRHYRKQIMTIALSVQNLSAGYVGNRNALTDVSFEVYQGERLSVIGPNGAGKSTLFKTLVGLTPHSKGEISLFGEDCKTSHSMIGYVPQYEAIDWGFPVTVYDVVMMGRTRKIGWLRFPRKQDRQVVQTVLEQVGMIDFKNRQIGELSGGQKRRVFIARALAQETQLLLLDEPFTGVDVNGQREIMHTLDDLTANGITLILSTHDLNVAVTSFDRMLLINQRVIACGTSGEVFQPDVLKDAYGGSIGFLQHNGQTVLISDHHT